MKKSTEGLEGPDQELYKIVEEVSRGGYGPENYPNQLARLAMSGAKVENIEGLIGDLLTYSDHVEAVDMFLKYFEEQQKNQVSDSRVISL